MKKNRTLRDMAVSSDVPRFANLPQQRGTLTKVTKHTADLNFFTFFIPMIKF